MSGRFQPGDVVVAGDGAGPWMIVLEPEAWTRRRTGPPTPPLRPSEVVVMIQEYPFSRVFEASQLSLTMRRGTCRCCETDAMLMGPNVNGTMAQQVGLCTACATDMREAEAALKEPWR